MNDTMKIYVARHGEKMPEEENPHLTERGVAQAKSLAEALKHTIFDELYSSELARAKETASEITHQSGVQAKVIPGLNEFKLSMLKKSQDEWTDEQKEHYKKLTDFLDTLTKRKEEDISILIVAHGITNRFILSYLIGLPTENLVQFMQKETGLNKFRWSKTYQNWRVEYWDRAGHLTKI